MPTSQKVLEEELNTSLEEAMTERAVRPRRGELPEGLPGNASKWRRGEKAVGGMG
jgi:hypothetical protein